MARRQIANGAYEYEAVSSPRLDNGPGESEVGIRQEQIWEASPGPDG